MAIVKLFTVRMRGQGSFTCRRCNRQVTLLDGGWLQLWDNGWNNLCRDTETLATVHRCGQEHYWYCLLCGEEREPLRIRARREPIFLCRMCDSDLVQRTRPVTEALEDA